MTWSGSKGPVAGGLAIEALRFGYRISGDTPAWRPLRAFDDGRQTFIEFPPAIAQDEAPPLFVIGPDGGAELVNYRVAGHFYVVDRLFAVAELRLGGKKQQIVRIARDDGRKLTIALPPELHRALDDYAEIYNRTYGEREPVAELVPHMLAAFLAGDRGFAKARGSLGDPS